MKKDRSYHKIYLPFAPTVNHYWGVHGKRRYIKKRGLHFREVVAVTVADLPKLVGKMWIKIIVHPPDNRRRDLDNLLKATLDALEKAELFKDDSDIDKIEVVRGSVVKPDGEMIVYIGEIE